MSLADKFEYLIGTKTAIRDALNESGARIDESLPFRQYAGWVEWLNYSRANVLRNFYSSGETGTLASDLPYFVDVDGNTPATWGDPVGLIRDASPNRADFTQPTVTARPILGRVPMGGRRNLFSINSENFGLWNQYGSGSDATLTDLGNIGPNNQRAFRYVLDDGITGNIYSTGRIFRLFSNSSIPETPVESVFFKPEGSTRLTLGIVNTGSGADGSFATIDLEDNSLVSSTRSSGFSVTTAGDGWFRLSVMSEKLSQTAVVISQVGFTGDGVSGVLISGFQIEADSLTPYQRRISQYNITEEGVPEVHYLSFDLTDDNLTTTLPSIENGTLVIAGTNGIWIDDDYNFDGGAFSIGPTTYTNGPEGILTAIGDPIERGFLVINRQLSQQERDLVIQEMKERGAPGVFELGPELIDPNLWVPNTSGVTFTEISPGEYEIASPVQYGGMRYPIASLLPSGTAYLLHYEFRNGTSNAVERVGPSGISNTWNVDATYDRQHYAGVSASNSASLTFRTGSRAEGGTVFAKNISLRKLELVP